MNAHFRLQRDLCLHESYTAVLETGVTQLAPIDRGGFDEISVALGHGQSGALSAQHLRFGDGATSAVTPAAARPERLPAESKYAHVVSGRRLPEAQVGCLCVATELLLRVYREFLAADYATLARFGLEYAVESKLNGSESALPMWARICGYEIAYVAECVEAPTPSATGFTRGASQRDIWSAGDDAVCSPLVLYVHEGKTGSDTVRATVRAAQFASQVNGFALQDSSNRAFETCQHTDVVIGAQWRLSFFGVMPLFHCSARAGGQARVILQLLLPLLQRAGQILLGIRARAAEQLWNASCPSMSFLQYAAIYANMYTWHFGRLVKPYYESMVQGFALKKPWQTPTLLPPEQLSRRTCCSCGRMS